MPGAPFLGRTLTDCGGNDLLRAHSCAGSCGFASFEAHGEAKLELISNLFFGDRMAEELLIQFEDLIAQFMHF